ncbi:MAG: LysR family transcriptional regulator [Ruminococcaceae bacterium]|nr:LysR family transcriptional regulator [Oscillospiraceae bacterium]
MNLKQFKYVLVLSQEGSFSGAAEVLNISQPSLSQYVKKIENELGMPLFDRTGGNVRLTDAGIAYIDAGRKILDIERQLQGSLTDIKDNKIGTLTVGTSPFRSAATMPDIVKEFKLKYPGIHVVVHEADTASLMEGLEHGEFDLCLTMLPVNEQLFDYEKICEEEMVLAVPAAYPRMQTSNAKNRAYDAVNVGQIHGKSFIAITETQFMQRAFDSMCAKYGVIVQKCVTVKSLEAQIAMVKAGLGMAFVPGEIKSFCKDDEVVFYSFEEDIPRREIVVVWRKDGALTKVSRELIQIMKTVSANKK